MKTGANIDIMQKNRPTMKRRLTILNVSRLESGERMVIYPKVSNRTGVVNSSAQQEQDIAAMIAETTFRNGRFMPVKGLYKNT